LEKRLVETEERLLHEYQEMYQKVKGYRSAPTAEVTMEGEMPPPPAP
jgi:hypothetical protein